jgi:hypothetical protein
MSILDGIDIHGGSGPFGGPFDVTWNTIEDSDILGPVTIDGYNGFWMGFIRNRVSETVALSNNVLVDEDVTILISGNLVCFGNSPAPRSATRRAGRTSSAAARSGRAPTSDPLSGRGPGGHPSGFSPAGSSTPVRR